MILFTYKFVILELSLIIISEVKQTVNNKGKDRRLRPVKVFLIFLILAFIVLTEAFLKFGIPNIIQHFQAGDISNALFNLIFIGFILLVNAVIIFISIKQICLGTRLEKFFNKQK